MPPVIVNFCSHRAVCFCLLSIKKQFLFLGPFEHKPDSCAIYFNPLQFKLLNLENSENAKILFLFTWNFMESLGVF